MKRSKPRSPSARRFSFSPFLSLSALLCGTNLVFRTSFSSRLLILLVSLFLFFLSYRKKKAIGFVVFFSLGLLCCLAYYHWVNLVLGETEGVGVVVRAAKNYVILFSKGQMHYVSSPNNAYEFGDVLSYSGKRAFFAETTYEGRFSFGEYLRGIGARYELSSPSLSTSFANPIRIGAMKRIFLGGYEEETSALLQSLLFGSSTSSSSTLSLLREMDLLFLFSGTGMFFSLYYSFLAKIGGILFEKKGASRFALALSVAFIPFVHLKAGVLRIYSCRLLAYFDDYRLKKGFSHLQRLGIAGLFLLLFKPRLAFDNGFLISLGISLSMYFLSRYCRSSSSIKSRLLRLLILRLFLLPVTLSSNGLHALSFILAECLLPFAFIYFFFGYFSFFTFLPCSGVLNPLTRFLESILQGVSKVDFVFPLPSLSTLGIFLYYATYLGVSLLHECSVRRGKNLLLVSSLALYGLSLLPLSMSFFGSVSFLNVGQGDSILIVARGKAVLLDTGGVLSFDMAEEVLIPYLRKRRIYSLDCLIASHQDYDHIGAGESLRNLFPVSSYVTQRSAFPLTIGPMKFENLNVYESEDENSSSLVLYLSLLGKSFLFMGDAPKEIEKQIIQDHPDLRADILKVGHHGSKTSTAEEFLDAIKPQEAIVSCGKKNGYGHPHASVLSLLSARNIKIRRTDEEGTIIYRGLVV